MAVQADRRKLGLAEMLVNAMKQTARAEGLEALIVPLRPTRKAEFPLVPMQDYMTWKCEKVPSTVPAGISSSMDNSQPTKQELPVDPWLRSHISLGGTMVKAAPYTLWLKSEVLEKIAPCLLKSYNTDPGAIDFKNLLSLKREAGMKSISPRRQPRRSIRIRNLRQMRD
ncbi:hypothetical protein PENARI_c072G08365 [Penicillium arizonense]|uniref:N-acetyltransferase domain-containing protein n=1 Tax=Penicillium arizonense TaxID=1835702 RepID=A0A1F5L1E7_PENAI|nr:hypothetical protein PENARI_c072G08365 [Penicillium arizonense]OGE47043.1 hypothetical protein PENARI_c072G08365 [Penicillium arizonense]